MKREVCFLPEYPYFCDRVTRGKSAHSRKLFFLKGVMTENFIVFRQAQPGDCERIWEIILQAKEQMRLAGKQQWQDGYPAQADIVRDVAAGYGYVLCTGERVVAYGAVSFDGEPAYEAIRGKWETEPPYVVVHRLAVADEMKQKGMAKLFLLRVEELCRRKGVNSSRVDTNFDNVYMLRLLEKLGYRYCGKIMYVGGERLAFEKRLDS